MDIRRTSADRTSALIETYLNERASLRRFLAARLGSEDEAEDLIQEIFFRLDRSPLIEVQNPIAYLYKMALNLARDHRRERDRAQARDRRWLDTVEIAGSEAATAPPRAEAAYGARERLGRIVQALEDLSPQCRRVFTLHKFEGLSHPEIARKLGVSRSTVEKHMGTALRHLVAQVGRE